MQEQNVIILPTCQLAYVRMTGPYPTSSVNAWQRVLEWLDARGHNVLVDAGFGLAIDDPRMTQADKLRYDAGVLVPSSWNDTDLAYVSLRKFCGGAYFKKRNVGCYQSLGRIVSEARDLLVPREGLIHDMARPVVTINYSYPSKTPPGEQIADICIPILADARLQPRVIH